MGSLWKCVRLRSLGSQRRLSAHGPGEPSADHRGPCGGEPSGVLGVQRLGWFGAAFREGSGGGCRAAGNISCVDFCWICVKSKLLRVNKLREAVAGR